ncbi:MAG: hypothetical protein U0470_08115 [Anaerolineae bacterium]
MFPTRCALPATLAVALALSIAACTPAAPTSPASQDAATPTSVATGEAAARTPTLAAAAVVTATAAVTGTAPADSPPAPPRRPSPTSASPTRPPARSSPSPSAVTARPAGRCGSRTRPAHAATTPAARTSSPSSTAPPTHGASSTAWSSAPTRRPLRPPPDPDAYFGPDYLAPDGVAAAAVEPTHLWLTVDSGVGAHGGSFALLSFDGTKLTLEAHASNGFPGVGRVEDLDGDGVGEVILDRTDAYVFCYACGVRAASVDVLKWTGDRLRPIELQAVAGDENAGYALDAVAGGFWEPAAALAQLALQSLDSTPPSAVDAARKTHHDLLDDQAIRADNYTEIKANRDARAALMHDDAPYPLLQHVFFGDWSGAVEPLRSIPPDRLFASDSPLVAGTAAEGNVEALAERIADAAGAALRYGPKLANAPYPLHWRAADSTFLRGWSAWLAAPGDAAARADIAEAAALAPDDPLYTASAAWIAQQP